jgi:Uma2 family endonuclease
LATVTEAPTPAASPPEAQTRRRTIGPADHGRAIRLADYEQCDFEEGLGYELSRGILIVTKIPPPEHGWIVRRTARLFDDFDRANPGVVTFLGGGGEARLRLPGMQSDRHPDQAVYFTPRPPGPDPWVYWTPGLVVEVVSEASAERDYVLKREEYLAAGVAEYWIVDPYMRRMLVLQRMGDSWREVVVPEGEGYRTHLLPGLVVDLAALLGPAMDNE